MSVFLDVGQVGVLYALSVMLFTALYTGALDMQRQYADNKAWYDPIAAKVWLMPPHWVFPLAWTLLYAAMAIALFLVARYGTFPSTATDCIFLLALLNIMANKAWSLVFFGLQRTRLALALLLLVLASAAAVAGLMAAYGFWPSFGLFLCYSLWCLFALYLNAAFVMHQDAELEDSRSAAAESFERVTARYGARAGGRYGARRLPLL